MKGKSAAIEVYKVKGYVDETGRDIVIETEYSTYASERSDKVVHDEPAREPAQVEDSSKLISVERTSFTNTAELEGFYVKMFGEMMGPFTESEFRYGIQAGEFPTDATYSEQKDATHWAPILSFGRPVPPPFTKKLPPPFRHKKPTPPPFRKNVA